MLAAIAMSILAAVQRFSEPVLDELGQLGTSRNFVAMAGRLLRAGAPDEHGGQPPSTSTLGKVDLR